LAPVASAATTEFNQQSTNTDGLYLPIPRKRQTLNEMAALLQRQTDDEREKRLQDYRAKLENLQRTLLQTKS
jgi:hypothetical protein